MYIKEFFSWYTSYKNTNISDPNSQWLNVTNSIPENISVTAITYDPNDTKIFYVGTGESYTSSGPGNGLWKSTDGGSTWNKVLGGFGASPEILFINDVVVRNNSGTSEVYVAAGFRSLDGKWLGLSDYGLYRSTNGKDFTQVSPVVPGNSRAYQPMDIEISPSNNKVWFSTTGRSLGYGGGTILVGNSDGTSFEKKYDDIKLETSLNAKLLQRSQKGVILTEAGNLFLPKIINILNNLSEAEQSVQSYISEPSGNVKIFLSPKLAKFISIRLYKKITKKYPKIQLQFEEGFGLRGGKLIENGEVDIGILPDWNFNIKINSKLIVSDNLYFYGKKDKIHNSNDPIKFAELINYPLVLTGAQIVLRQKLNSISYKLKQKLQIILESGSQTYTESFINEGLAYSIGPSEASYLERINNNFFAREIVEPNISRSVTLCWPKSKAMSKAAEIVASNIVFIIKDLLKEKILVGNYKITKEDKILN